MAPTARIEAGSPGEVRVREGDRLQLRCDVTGFPPPTVHWYRKVRMRSRTIKKLHLRRGNVS